MSRIYHFHPEQTWGCVMCGKCCGRDWPVPADPEERRRIAALSLPDVKIPAGKWFRTGFIAKKNGKCIFSTCDGKRCIIHEKYGLDVKALACRLYPLDIHAWEDGSISASLRYDCPAVANGTENSLPTAIVGIDRMADEIARYRRDPAPRYSPEIHPSLERLREIAQTYSAMLEYPGQNLNIRFLAASELLNFHRGKEASLDITEAEDFQEDALALTERSLKILSAMLETAPEAGFSAFVGFRYLLLSFLRNDNGMNAFKRFRRLKKHLDFTLGNADLEIPGGKIAPGMKVLPAEPDAFVPFMRWLKGRLASLHFCGGAAFGITFEEGMRFLLLSLPAAAVTASALAETEKLTRKDVSAALMLLDYSFLRTKLYRGRFLRKTAESLTSQEWYPILLKNFCPC